MNNKLLKKINAFTLIELLVVIAIVGILSGLILLTMNSATTSANDAKAKAELNQLQKSILIYAATNSLPVSSPSPCIINNNTSGTGCTGVGGLNAILTAQGVALPPSTSNYKYTSNGTSFSLTAPLSNRSYTITYTNNTALSCPTDWIDSGHGFCVMKYEARSDGTTNCLNAAGGAAACPVSQTSGTPWVSISQLNAIAACSSLGNGAHLITNAEWMMLVNDIVNQGTNWTTGTVGSGILARGFVNTGNTAVAPSTGTGYEYNTGANTVGASGTIDYRRTLNLANSQVIWDLSGNVWEWTNDTITGSNSQATPTGWKEYTAVTNWGALTSNDTMPTNNSTLCGGSACTSSNGIGRFYTDTTLTNTCAFIRGGNWGSGSNAGAFALLLDSVPTNANTHIGFRCAR